MRKILVAITMGTLLAASAVVALVTAAPAGVHNGGTEVVKVTVGGGSSSLPRTGASGTGTTVRIALVAIGVGLVLVVGARRRRRVRA